ncbi:Crp/Fnr family transcriptional regulator [Mangrovibacterium lignilyticum]|uniref:Crp/Fnr family transcriptional regulator n=1 Tax=Mangrovibacterium lignilyticum TaxID=2668052 RepID=UPI0013D618E7|nr:Crp/Fnr family transcriptional regulator [Mangrovibacterium lignilyticum]
MLSAILQAIYTELEENCHYTRPYGERLIPLLQQLEREAGSELSEALQFHDFEIGRFLLKTGRVSDRIWVLLDGVAREYMEDEKKCYVTRLFYPGEFVGNYNSSFNRCRSQVSIQLATPSRVLSLEWKQIRLLEQKYPVVTILEKLIFLGATEQRKHHAFCLRQLSASDFYVHLRETHPGLDKQVSLTIIANCMGIKLSSLSRIRSQLGISDAQFGKA